MRFQLRLNPALPDLLARSNISITTFANQATVGRSTLFALLNPASNPERRGGMRRITAWRLAKAYAHLTGIDEEMAYHIIIVEE